MAMNRKNICDTKPTQLLREVGRKTLAYVSLSRRRRRRRRRSAFIYHTFHQSAFFYTQPAVRSPQSVFYTDRHKFIHTHNLLQYYKVGDQASVEVEGVEEQMLIFLSSLTPGRVKGF